MPDNKLQADARSEPTVLTVFLETPSHLRGILTGLNWKVHEVHELPGLVQFLSKHAVPVVICHCLFGGGSWKDVLDHISVLYCPPKLIVTSETADDYLWAEVLNLGGYDVISQPFSEPEVARTLGSALRRWQEDTTHAAL